MSLHETSPSDLSLSSESVNALSLVRADVPVSELVLPQCVIPRPGDTVVWYQKSKKEVGELLGHDWLGRPIVVDAVVGGSETLTSFTAIRREESRPPVGPNWTRPDGPKRSVRPSDGERATFRDLLSRRVPPGPQHRDLVEEIHQRGFEVFVVGGTVRDVIRGRESHDVDLATTMPLLLLFDVLQRMYSLNPRQMKPASQQHGHLRLGGREGSEDPYIDLSVFRLKQVGSEQAMFATRFDRDLAYRDFTMNSLYFDPVNDVIHDPALTGLDDCHAGRLRVTLEDSIADAVMQAKVVLRAAKFAAVGFTVGDDNKELLSRWACSVLPAMLDTEREAYIREYLLGGTGPGTREAVVENSHDFFAELGAVAEWTKFVEPLTGDDE